MNLVKKPHHIIFLFLGLISFFILLGRTNILQKNNSAELNSCVKTSSTYSQCLEKNVKYIVRKEGIQKGINAILTWKNTTLNSESSCHSLMHIVGREAYILFLAKKEVAADKNALFCAFGMYHGFMEELFAKSNNLQEAINFCEYLNSQFIKQGISTTYGRCYHGIGHGIVDIHRIKSENELLDSLNKALDICKKIGTTETKRSGCIQGVFNSSETFYLEGPGMKNKFNTQDPFALCRKFQTEYNDCYHFMTDILFVRQKEILKSYETIISLSHTNNISLKQEKRALQSLAYSYGRDFIGDDFASGQKTCLAFQKSFFEECVSGFIEGLLTSRDPRPSLPFVLVFCDTSLFSQDLQRICYEHAIRSLKDNLNSSQIDSICKNSTLLVKNTDSASFLKNHPVCKDSTQNMK